MEFLAEYLVFCILLTLVTSSPGFEFYRKLPANGYCARLECSANITQTDNQVSFIYKLAIYDITQTNMSKVKLASVSVLDPGLYLNPTKASVIHGLGTLSTKSYGNLTLDLLDKTDCHDGSFLCELDFVNESEQTDVLKKFVLPDGNNNEQTKEILSILNQIKSIIVAESADTDAQLADLRNDTAFLKTEVSKLGNDNAFLKSEVSKLGNDNAFLKTEVSKLGNDNAFLKTEVSNLRNQSSVIQKTLDTLIQRLDVTQAPNNPAYNTTIKPSTTTCVRGAAASSSRVPFMLWGRIPAICDTETDGGGWVIIQRRTKGDVDFYRQWADYKNGFGNTSTDFWIGNDVIHNLTAQGYSTVWIDLVLYDNTHNYAKYSNFYVGDEASLYKLKVSDYTGTVGDSLFYHNGANFSTYDRNNAPGPVDCLKSYHGGWWYKQCFKAYLNGQFNTTNSEGNLWQRPDLVNLYVSSTEIKLRHV